MEQLEDPRLGRVGSGPYKNQEGMRIDGYGRLCRKQAIVVPRTLQAEVTEMAHRLSPVAGIEKSIQYIKERFFWFGMRKTIEEFCAAYGLKTKGGLKRGNLSNQYVWIPVNQEIQSRWT